MATFFFSQYFQQRRPSNYWFVGSKLREKTQSMADQRPVLRRGLNIVRLCAHDAAQQSPKSPIRVKWYCDGGYQLNLSSPVLCFVLCTSSHKRGHLTYYSTSVRKWIDPGPHISLKMSRFLLCKARIQRNHHGKK